MLEILKNNLNTNINVIYNTLIKDSYNLFSKFTDEDFFSDKVQHIYFYSDIDNDSVNNLQKILLESAKTKMDYSGITISPKPIVIHLKSPGGTVISTDIFYTIFQSLRVPLCIIIEGFCCSAATFLALLAPYRVIINFSTYMIHDAFGGNLGKKSNTIKSNYQFFYLWIYYNELLKTRTKLTDEDIKKFIDRDIFIDSNYCLKKNIVDRILEFPNINKPNYFNNVSNLQLNLTNFLKKTNLNHIFIDEEIMNNYNTVINGINYNGNISEEKNLNDLTILLDNNFLIKKDNFKPIIIHFKSIHNQSIYALSNPLNYIQLNYRLALIQKKIPIIAFIEGQQYFDMLSSIMMCPIRIMMKPSIIQSTFSYINSSLIKSIKTIDVIENSQFIFKNVVKFYKKTTNLPNNFYIEMKNKIINLKPKELLKFDIIHLCLNINKKNITNKDIIKYLQLNNLIGFKHNNKLKDNNNLKDKFINHIP